MLLFPIFFAVCLLAHGDGFIQTLFVNYEDGEDQGHYELGKAIGLAMGDDIWKAWAGDSQLQNMEAFVQTTNGKRIFENFITASTGAFPLYTREIEGMADGARMPRSRFFVNQLREELSQWVEGSKRTGHCTDAYAKKPGVAAWGHNEDWTQYWRNASYFVIATALNGDGSTKFKFGSYVYPGFLLGETLTWNSYGMAYTGNSLFPKHFLDSGVGTAWVARSMAESRNFEDLVRRGADPRVSTAMNYNVASIQSKRMWSFEIKAAGIHATKEIQGPDFHVNQFRLLDVDQFPEASSQHREDRWNQLRPDTVQGIRQFLSDRQDQEWPVWRNQTGNDNCFTQITGIFDLERRVISAWTSPAAQSAPEFELPLEFPGFDLGWATTDLETTELLA